MNSRNDKCEKNNNNLTGLIIIITLGIIGVLIIYNTWDCDFPKGGIIEYLWYHGLEFFMSLLFIILAIVAIYKSIINYLIPPAKDIMYLKEISYNTMYFVDRQGKKISYFEKNPQYKIGKYYLVLRSTDEIKEVYEETNDTFEIVKEKESYWVNMYTPFGNFEDILILPIGYLFLIIGVISIILSEPEEIAYGIAFTIIPAFIIIYDYIYINV